MLISVCVATYKRPKKLRLLLEGLNQLVFVRIDQPEIEVIVVDVVISLLYICRGLGTLGGLLGLFYEEYKNVSNLTSTGEEGVYGQVNEIEK